MSVVKVLKSHHDRLTVTISSIACRKYSTAFSEYNTNSIGFISFLLKKETKHGFYPNT